MVEFLLMIWSYKRLSVFLGFFLELRPGTLLPVPLNEAIETSLLSSSGFLASASVSVRFRISKRRSARDFGFSKERYEVSKSLILPISDSTISNMRI